MRESRHGQECNSSEALAARKSPVEWARLPRRLPFHYAGSHHAIPGLAGLRCAGRGACLGVRCELAASPGSRLYKTPLAHWFQLVADGIGRSLVVKGSHLYAVVDALATQIGAKNMNRQRPQKVAVHGQYLITGLDRVGLAPQSRQLHAEVVGNRRGLGRCCGGRRLAERALLSGLLIATPLTSSCRR